MNKNLIICLAACLPLIVGAATRADSLLAKDASALSFDSTSLKVDGERTYLVSGEFHYFRVPQADWRRRMRLLKDAGGNCLATYVPWIVHEPEEGKIVFGDTPARDLDKFLRMAKEEGLMVIIRPGPYQYSELANSGLPTWLVEKYPEILLKKSDGSIVGKGSVDYNHPTFLAKARPYFRAVAKILKPHLAVNGGPIVLTQLDNELTGIHVWFGYQPSERYYEDCAKYLETLKNWLIEDGITGPYCHNAGGALMSASYKTCADRLGNRDFLLGYDHYYGLFQSDREAPVPYYFFEALFACDILRGWGYPPVGFEIQAGTIGNVPPILKEDLLAAWMCNLAAGMKGINYYVFTGGPNVPGTAGDPDMELYDYQAPIGPDGTVRENYGALKDFGAFIKGHPELVAAERLTSVRVGLEWQHEAHLAPFDEGFNRFGMFYALMLTDYSPEYFLLDREIPLDGKPLVLAGVTSMSAEAQRRVAAFVEKGGKILVAPDFPRVDLAGKPCTILADAAPDAERIDKTWKTHFFAQADRVAAVLAKFGAKPIVRSTNRNVFATAFRLADGSTGVFALNLRSGSQQTRLELPSGAFADVALKPMSVEYRRFVGQYVSVSCNPTNAVVAVNEQVTFTVAVKDAQGELLPTGSVTVILDNIGAKLFVSNRVDLAKENPIKISGSLSEPGFLRVKVLSPEIANPTPYNKDVVVFSCAVDPFKFEQQYPCPEDFDSFWSAARERLAKEVPLDPQIVLDPAHANDNDFTWYHVSFATFGRRVYGHLVVPKDIPSGTRLPVRVQVPGAGFGSWSNIPDVRKGYISFFLSVFPWQLETNFEPNRVKYDQMNDDFRARKLNVGTMPDTTCYHVSGIARSREGYFYYPLILGMDRAIDWLAQRPDVDPKRITYHGTSQGGAFGLFLMGLNRNFSRGVVYVPALTGQHLREQGLEDTWPWFADVARANAAYFDTGNFAARVRCPIRFAVGLSDTLCPPTGVLAAYNACTSSDKDIVFGVGMSHDVYDWIYQRLDNWEVSTTH